MFCKLKHQKQSSPLCPRVSLSLSGSGGKSGSDPETGSVASFGTLRRAHIDRKKVSRTSFYLRVGALGQYNSFHFCQSKC